MDRQNYYIILYDFYGSLLTEKQQKYFEYYYFDNLSLQEISELLNVSRNAIHKTLKNISEKLDFYESRLQLNYKKQKLSKILEGVDINIKNKIEKLY